MCRKKNTDIMKGKKSTVRHTVPAALCPRDAAGQRNPLLPLNVINLRPGSNGTLVPVGENIRHEGFGASTPLLMLRSEGREVIAAASGSDLIYGKTDAGAGTDVEPDFFGSQPLCAIPVSSDAGVVMCTDGAVQLSMQPDGTLATSSLARSYAPIGMVAVESSPISTTVAARTLSRNYDGASRLSASDTAAVSADLVDAYRRLTSTAGAAGLAIQPALARYRLIDNEGRCVFTSAPVLLSLPSGSQCADTVGITSSDRRTLDPYTLSARTWALQLSLPAADTKAGISRADIYLSPLFHPYVPVAAADITTSRASSSDAPFIYAGLPGRERSLGNNFNGHARRLLASAIARLDSIEQRVAVVNEPFSGPQRTVKADIAFNCDCVAEAKSLTAALAAPAQKYDRMSVVFAPPHTFTARCAASDAATVLWANLTARHFPGYPLAGRAATFGESALWRGTTRIRFASGGSVVLSESHISPVPLTFNPLLYYPLPDAVEISISVSTAGTVRSATFTLTPDESGRGALFAEGCAPFALTGSEAVDTTQTDSRESYPYAVAVAATSDPLHIDSIMRLGSGPVAAVIARGATDQAWEFGRSRFIVGAAAGIYSLGVGTGRTALSSRRLSAAPVTRADALCRGEGGEAFALSAAGSATIPLHIRPNGSVSTFAPSGPYLAAAFDSLRGELWLLRSDSSADIFCLHHDGAFYRRTGIAATGARMLGDQAFACTPVGLISLGQEQAKDIAVGINCLYTPRTLDPVTPLAIEFAAVAVRFKGSMTLESADAGAGGRTCPVVRASIGGALLSPIRLRTATRPARRFRFGFEGTVSPDFTYSHCNISYRQ